MGHLPMTTMTLTGPLALLLAVTLLIGCGSDYPATGATKSAPAGTAGAATPAKSTQVRIVPAMEEQAAPIAELVAHDGVGLDQGHAGA